MRGSIRRLRDGVYEVRVYIGRDPVKGTPKQISRTVHGSRRDADAVSRQLIENLGTAGTDASNPTFGQLLDKWLEAQGPELSPTTLRTYQSQIERTIRPALGSIRLSRLTAKHLDDLYRAMREQDHSAKTIRNHHAIISAALSQATRWGWLRDNVANRARPPRVTQRRIKAPSVAAVRAVIKAAEERDPRLAPLVVLAALTGMRRAELCALRWTDVNMETGELEVSRSVVVVPGGLREKSTKTDRARPVALDQVAVALLRRHRAQVEEWAAAVETAVAPDGFVFSPYLDGSAPFRPDNVTGFFIRVRDSVGLKSVRLHDLRHFTATQLIGAGVDVRTVAGRLGHSDPSVTLRVYADVIQERDRAAAALIGGLLAANVADL